MSKTKRTFVTAFMAVVMCVSAALFGVTLTASAAGKKTFEVTGITGDLTPIVTFSSDFDGYLAENITFADAKKEVADFVFVNGKSITELNAEAPKYQFHQYSNNHFWYPTAGNEFKAGDVIEYKEGMQFMLAAGGFVDGVTLAGNYKYMFNGATWAVPTENMVVAGVDALVTEPGDEVTPDCTKISIKTTGIIADELVADAEAQDNVKNNIFIGGVSVAQINADNQLTDLLGDSMNAVRVFFNPTSIDLYVHQEAKINGKTLSELESFDLKVAAALQAPKGMTLAEDYSATYLAYCSFWATSVYDKVEQTEVATPQNLSEVAVKYENGSAGFYIPFNEAVFAENQNFYNATPTGLVRTPAAGRGVESINKAVTDGTYESMINNIILNGKALKDWYKEFGEDPWGQSTGIMIHTRVATEERGASLECWISETVFNKDAEITLTLKSGLLFPTGYYLDKDIELKQVNGSFGNVGTVTLNAEQNSLYPNQQLQMNAVLSDDAGTQTITYSVDNQEVATIDASGKLTAVKAGKVVVTATSTRGAVATFEVTVLENTVTDIKLQAPSKVEYEQGTDLDLAGAKLTVTYADGTTKEVAVESAMVSGFNKDTVGKQTVTVTFGEKTATFEVTVNAKVVNPETPDTPEKPEEEKGGCGSSIAISSAVLASVAVGCAVVFLAKRKQSEIK